ncbi:PREDICTED: mutS protein homolog 5-like [Priapulus caudatus]|uniref:MutS protein homolog 5-like n=1 Tax=Priapulus caudatus TaxID=37621 RepID=A0ABM1EPM8_PRICU|nr:PREDICTED: mutS protein homolog 5-like [Priapulus caudatus]
MTDYSSTPHWHTCTSSSSRTGSSTGGNASVSGRNSCATGASTSSRFLTSTACSTNGSTSTRRETDISEEMDIDDVTVHRTDTSSEEEHSQVFLSIIWSAGTLGAAHYDTSTSEMHLMGDVAETMNYELLRAILSQIEPSSVITSSKQDERMISILKQSWSKQVGDSMETTETNSVQLLPSTDFAYEYSKRRLMALNLQGMESMSDDKRLLYMSSLINFDNINMVKAAGGLLKYLDKMRVGVQLEDNAVKVPVLALKFFSLSDMVLMDDNTLRSLQIFHKERHPSAYKAPSYGKEGLSVFGIMNKCRSRLGAVELRLWFLRPTRDVAYEQSQYRRHQPAARLPQACQERRILSKMTTAQATIGDWQALYKTAYNAIFIGDICRAAQASDVAIFKKIGHVFTDDLECVASLISRIMDFDESVVQNRFVVKLGIDEELDNKKKTFNGLPDFMTKVAGEELKRLDERVEECNVIYLPQIGYLLAIPKSDLIGEEQNYQLPGLTFMFFSNNVIYYKSASMEELDQRLGDTQCEITDHETRIMHRLQDTILKRAEALRDVMTYTAQLDCLISLATAAMEYNYVQPELSSRNELLITGGRHPLQELCVPSFVPNDTSSTHQGRVKVLTGPNSSGKSVYLKQVGVIVFLAHIGSFVPAEGAKIGLVDRILSRIRTDESVSIHLSTFMIDLNQMALCLRSATERSLVLIDEFGKGTTAVDGVALLTASIEHWLDSGDKCPHVFVSTHYHMVTTLLQPTPQLKLMTMEVLEEEGETTYLYNLVDGRARSSLAHVIAARAGLPAEIIRRGIEVTELLRANKAVFRVDLPRERR